MVETCDALSEPPERPAALDVVPVALTREMINLGVAQPPVPRIAALNVADLRVLHPPKLNLQGGLDIAA